MLGSSPVKMVASERTLVERMRKLSEKENSTCVSSKEIL